MPTTVPSQNSHRIVLLQPDRTTDLDRIEDLAADAIGAARSAVIALDRLSHEVFRPLEKRTRIVREAAGRRRVLTEDFRHAATDILRALDTADVDGDVAKLRDETRVELRRALDLSHRVADLLAAEDDVGWHRGLGR